MKKLLTVFLAALLLLSAAACGTIPEEPHGEDIPTPLPETVVPDYVPEDNEAVYTRALGEARELLAEAEAAANTPNEQLLLYAAAEAALLDAAVIFPTDTEGGDYMLSRIVPHTESGAPRYGEIPRLESLVVTEELLTAEERSALLALYHEAVAAWDLTQYDPTAWLIEAGHSFAERCAFVRETMPTTLDIIAASETDAEVLINCTDGLAAFDAAQQLRPALAESWDVSTDGRTFTFRLHRDAFWYTADGYPYVRVVAGDFAAGLRHLLDMRSEFSALAEEWIVGCAEYARGGSFEDVGIRAVDPYTLEITLTEEYPVFPALLAGAAFRPICKTFYESRGGVFGIEELAEAKADGSYAYARADDIYSQVYCGPYHVSALTDTGVSLDMNDGYYDAGRVTLKEIDWLVPEDKDSLAEGAASGRFSTVTFGEEVVWLVPDESEESTYLCLSDTGKLTRFGALQLNRSVFPSDWSEQQKSSTHTALQNINFRKAILLAADKELCGSVTRGVLALTNLRNMLCSPELTFLHEDTADADGHIFPAGTAYGELVQYYADARGADITTLDSVNGWYNPALAAEYLAQAIEELGDTVSYPVRLDIGCRADDDVSRACAEALKDSIETALGSINVTVTLTETDDAAACDLFFGGELSSQYDDPADYLSPILQ